MLNAQEVNALLAALFHHLEAQVPALAPLSVAEPAAVRTTGAYGSVIWSALFTGDLEGKATLTLDWETAYLIAEVLLRKKSDGFSAEAQHAVSDFFQAAFHEATKHWKTLGRSVHLHPLPLQMDADVLLSEDGRPGAARFSIHHQADKINLYLAVHRAAKKAAA